MPDVLSEVKIYNLGILQTVRPEILFVESDTAFTFKKDGFIYRNHILHRFEIEQDKVKSWSEYMNAIRRDAAYARVLR